MQANWKNRPRATSGCGWRMLRATGLDCCAGPLPVRVRRALELQDILCLQSLGPLNQVEFYVLTFVEGPVAIALD